MQGAECPKCGGYAVLEPGALHCLTGGPGHDIVLFTRDPEKVVGPDLAPYARQLFREAGWRQQADDAIRVRQIDSAGNVTGGPSSAPAILERLTTLGRPTPPP